MEYKLFAVRVFVTDWERVAWAQMAPGDGQLALERVDPSDQEGRALVYVFCGGFGSSRSTREMKRSG